MEQAGYSGTPLFKKLDIREGFKIRLYQAPDHFMDLLENLPSNVHFMINLEDKKDLIHFFTDSAIELHDNIKNLREEIKSNGIIWVSWPKKASKIMTDINEDYIRNLALKNGLVDVKVCAVDDKWSALKLVIPLKDRIK